ncbi:MAG: radical SAM protein [Acidobacteriales bacterium]|nr:radical SAM protein [Terriglobales bacterium]
MAKLYMNATQILPVWGRILQGRKPFLSIEVTRECPLRCPGCYAYSPAHVENSKSLRVVPDLTGNELVQAVLTLTRRTRPVHVSFVGGEPLVRFRELDILIPLLKGLELQLVTSAVRPIPREWAAYRHLHVVVSVDGLPPEHDRRRAPATYARVLDNISGHRVIIHCTVTRQLLRQPGYLREFAALWSGRTEARKIWFSLFTPQADHFPDERLTQEDRKNAVAEIARVASEFDKVYMPDGVLDSYLRPPHKASDCIFSQLTHCVSADLKTEIAPCEFGGRPTCSECGCMASAGMAAIGRYRLAGLVRVSDILQLSNRIGRALRRHL